MAEILLKVGDQHQLINFMQGFVFILSHQNLVSHNEMHKIMIQQK